MGVLSCDRNGCENIMCDYYSYEYGYICWECRNELITKGPCDIKDFMDSPKPLECFDTGEAWETFINLEFRDRK